MRPLKFTPKLFPLVFYTIVGLVSVGLAIYGPRLTGLQTGSSPNVYARGRIVEVYGQEGALRGAAAELLNGPDQGQRVEIGQEEASSLPGKYAVRKGDTLVLIKTETPTGVFAYHIAERYRIPALVMIGLLCVAAIIYFGQRRGVSSLVGLIFTILVIVRFMVPAILAGANAFGISVIGSLLILAVGLYLAHGLNQRTTVALLSTALTVLFALVLGEAFVRFAYLFGLGSEAAFYLQIAQTDSALNLRGLLLGAIVIGALGVLDDVTTTQTAAIEELQRANPLLSRKQLYNRGMAIGREHIASLVNTLALAYVGASFPLLLLFTFYRDPLWVVFNSELIAEEVVRTLVGSLALVIAVPVSTFFAAWYFSRGRAYVQHHQAQDFPT